MGSIIDVLEYLVRNIMGDDESHGYPHVLRVRKLALWIASKCKCNVDYEVLELASILHDIGRISPESKNLNHALVSAKIAEAILGLMGYPKDKMSKVVNAIASHSYSLNVEPRSMEAKILSDADKLDALGAMGIARVFMYSGKHNRSLKDTIKHIKSKIINLPKLMYTDIAREEALRRVNFVKKFLEELERELKLIK